MPANTNPIFVLSPAIGSVVPTAANVKSDGAGTIGTDIFKAFTADATNGSFVSMIRLSPFASVAATATTATTLRIFISSATSGAVTSANAWLFQEISAAAQTAAHSTNATFFIEVPVNRILPASYTILVTTHVVSAANTGWQATVFAGNY